MYVYVFIFVFVSYFDLGMDICHNYKRSYLFPDNLLLLSIYRDKNNNKFKNKLVTAFTNSFFNLLLLLSLFYCFQVTALLK